ncbi:MAG: CoA transferase [Actinomycetota bacterium]|nr:CoA transferase [Actinomycetota bacterium]
MVGTQLGEFGAEVIKVEPPGTGDPMRTWGARKHDVGLMWKSVTRNKRCVTLDLRCAEGQELFHRLVDGCDVLIVGNRPSALQRWGIDWESVHAAHPAVVMCHVSGYGAGGPAADRPGYGTLAEAMSGFAHLTGQPDGPPTLPPFMLADGVASMAAAFAVMAALYHRDIGSASPSGGQAREGQLIDVNLIEPLARLMEWNTLSVDQLGVVPGRVGNRLDASAPRNAYATADDRWLAVSSASPSVAVRLFRTIGRDDLAEDPDVLDPLRRQARAGEIDHVVADWIRQRPLAEALEVLLAADVAVAPVYDGRQLLDDEHLRARGTFVEVDDEHLGRVRVQSPVARLSATPATIGRLGPELGADNDDVYAELLGLGTEERAALSARGVI